MRNIMIQQHERRRFVGRGGGKKSVQKRKDGLGIFCTLVSGSGAKKWIPFSKIPSRTIRTTETRKASHVVASCLAVLAMPKQCPHKGGVAQRT
ncbi:hypothetical protein AVEN_26893-1 [Araneus ventricosus]|uniref:Uncharacterized protein n=1 Tax=Araneus ventricosus TaxID=182803 RepID=A0A4Y2KHH0_ARAVE|nr:hypothetical protein AVEN_26893-1 [Araneus ventricosus]